MVLSWVEMVLVVNFEKIQSDSFSNSSSLSGALKNQKKFRQGTVVTFLLNLGQFVDQFRLTIQQILYVKS